MSTSLASPAAPRSSLAAGAARLLLQVVRECVALGKALAHRRQVMEMLELDDRLLKDIGLARSDVLGALAEPFAHDPSIILRLRSIDHRVRQRETQLAVDRARAAELS